MTSEERKITTCQLQTLSQPLTLWLKVTRSAILGEDIQQFIHYSWYLSQVTLYKAPGNKWLTVLMVSIHIEMCALHSGIITLIVQWWKQNRFWITWRLKIHLINLVKELYCLPYKGAMLFTFPSLCIIILTTVIY